jgi:hypothetical protein
MYRLRKQTSLKMNKILEIHAEWLDYNYSKLAGNKCRKQAKEYSQKTDKRQTMNRRKYE